MSNKHLRGGAPEKCQPAHGCLGDAAGPVSATRAAPTARPDEWELVNTVNLLPPEALGHPCCAVTLIRVSPRPAHLGYFAQPSPAPHVSRHRCICALRTPVSRPGIDSIDVMALFNTQKVNYFNSSSDSDSLSGHALGNQHSVKRARYE